MAVAHSSPRPFERIVLAVNGIRRLLPACAESVGRPTQLPSGARPRHTRGSFVHTHTIRKAGLVGTLAAAAAFSLGGTSAGPQASLPVVSVPQRQSEVRHREQRPDPVGHRDIRRVRGSLPLTNPDVANGVTHYGYNTADGGATHADDERGPQDGARQERLPTSSAASTTCTRATRSAPAATSRASTSTRPTRLKRVTLILRHRHGRSNAYPTIDGITWDPFTEQLGLTAESSAPKGGVFGVRPRRER